MSELAWVALRAAGLVLLLQAAGTTLFLAGFARQAAALDARIRRTGRVVALGALALIGAQCVMEPVHMAGEWAGTGDAGLWRLLFGSATGASLALRGAGATLLALTSCKAGRVPAGLAVAGVALILGSFLLTGHTVSAAHHVLLRVLLLVHLACAAFWFGALLPLRQLCARAAPAAAGAALAAFSAAALWLVPMIALAGVTMALLLLPDGAAWLTPYGLLLLGKATLFALLMGIAALNRLRLAPALSRGLPRAGAQLRVSIALEYGLIVTVLSLTAVLTGFYSPVPEPQ